MKILSAQQIREADRYTIENEPIASIDLMERAAQALQRGLWGQIFFKEPYFIMCGMGNNGGDGLALARLLHENGSEVKVCIAQHSREGSPDFQTNLKRLQETEVEIIFLEKGAKPAPPAPEAIVIDALLGSGLSRPLEGWLRELVLHLNTWSQRVIAVDMPTGLMADDNSENDLNAVWKAEVTLTLQLPKLSMFNTHTASLCGEVEVLDNGLHPDFLSRAETPWKLWQEEDARTVFVPRQRHSYKGTYGHALLMAGSRGSAGAAILAATAGMRSGAGLLTAAVPASGLIPLQTALPEAMALPDRDENHISGLPEHLEKYAAIGAGPGMGQAPATARMLKKLLNETRVPLVLDADALNILAANPGWLNSLPENTILTPHPGEFKRLAGNDPGLNYPARIREWAMEQRVVVIYKDSITAVALPDGQVFFVDEGSPALATAGSGDVLTGIVLGLLCSGYTSSQAALLGTWLHARAGRIAGAKRSEEAALAGDIIRYLGKAFRKLYPSIWPEGAA